MDKAVLASRAVEEGSEAYATGQRKENLIPAPTYVSGLFLESEQLVQTLRELA